MKLVTHAMALLSMAVLVVGCTSVAPTRGIERELIQEVRLAIDGDRFTPDQIVVKANTPVRLLITAVDADYDFSMTELGIGSTPVQRGKTVLRSFSPVLGTYRFSGVELGTSTKRIEGKLVATACSPEMKALQNPVPTNAESVAAGSRIFADQCASCHGPEGKGDGAAASAAYMRPIDLTKPYMRSITDGEIFWVLRDGLGAMPSFKDTLPDRQKWEVINFLRTLSAGGG